MKKFSYEIGHILNNRQKKMVTGKFNRKFRLVTCWKCGATFIGINRRSCCYSCIEKTIQLNKSKLKNGRRKEN